jgi:hypothetical protein
LGGDPEVTLVGEGITTEWAGPGIIDEPLHSSWYTEWFDFHQYITPPWDDWTGFIVVNPRWEFYRDSYMGKKPTVFGTPWPPP